MKIGFVLDDSLDSSDGVQQYILTLGKWFSDQGHQVHYLVGQTKRTDLANIHSLSKNIGVRFNGNRMSIPLPANKRHIKRLLQSCNFDVLHLQMPYSPFLGGRVLRLASKYSPQTKLVGTFHILPFGRLQRAASLLLHLWLRRTSKLLQTVWSVSKPAADFAKQLGIDSKVLSNSVDLAAFRVPKPKNKRFTIVFLGRLVERKGCTNLLQAISMLKNTNGLQVLIGGRGPQLGQLRRQAELLGLSKTIVFKGFIAEDQKASFLAKADLAIFPSTSGESFGIVLLEAMAAGAGVVLAGDNPGYNSVLGDLDGSIIDPHKPANLARHIDDLRIDSAKFAQLHKAQQQLVKRFDVAIIGKKLLSYY